jgi:hypothetical protein
MILLARRKFNLFFWFRFIVSGKGFRYECGQILIITIGCLCGKNNRFYSRMETIIRDSTVVQAGTLHHPPETHMQ